MGARGHEIPDQEVAAPSGATSLSIDRLEAFVLRNKTYLLAVWLIAVCIALFLFFRVFPSLEPDPRGIIDLEVAGQPSLSKLILGGWSGREVADVRLGLKIDYLFMVAYAISLAGAVALVSGGFRAPSLRKATPVMAAGALLAGLLDAIENLMLFQVLNDQRSPWPELAAAAAWPKLFVLVGIAVYVAVGLVLVILSAAQRRLRPNKPKGKALPPPSDESPATNRPGIGLISQRLPQPHDEDLFERDTPVPEWRKDDWEPTPKKLGICCSGGGVRSAAYNLGALQALQELGELKRASFVSAVSGGAYIAAAYAMVENDSRDQSFDDVPVFAPRSPEEQHVRSNSSYLASGVAGKAKLVGRLSIGLLVNILFMCLLLLTIARPFGWLLHLESLYPNVKDRAISVPYHLWFTGWPLAIALAIALFTVLTRFDRIGVYRAWIKVANGFLAFGALLLSALIVIPVLGEAIPAFLQWLIEIVPVKDQVNKETSTRILLIASALGAGSLGPLAWRLLTKHSSKIAGVAVGFIFPLVVVVTFVLFVWDATADSAAGYNGTGWWVVGILILSMFYAASDVTTWSMHPFYKQRLCSAFAVGRESPTRAVPLDYDDLQELSRYRPKCSNPTHVHDLSQPHSCEDPLCGHQCTPWPELVVCAAANITDEGATPTGRNSVSFTFSSNEIGSPDVGWIRTTDMEGALSKSRSEDITLPAAVAISGAALSPAMGKMSKQSFRALLAITNARLGVWLPNPRWVKKAIDSDEEIIFKERPRVSYLFREIFGIHRRDEPFLYVSDGGHWENLGLVELMRRGCTEIYCFDASGDHVDTFFTLGEAVAIARTELGIEVRIDPSELREVPIETTLTHSTTTQSTPQAESVSVTQSRDEETESQGAVVKSSFGTSESREASRSSSDGTETVIKGATDIYSKTTRTIATFSYPGTELAGRIVFCKTAVTEDAPWDVKAYAQKDPRFPMHSTVDQLYTDQRFEAYRALGWYSADQAVNAMEDPSLT